MNIDGTFLKQVYSAVSLKRLNTWHVGGEAEYLFQPKARDDLAQFLGSYGKDLPLTWLGLGSNVLVPDEGISGVVICTQNYLKKITALEDNMLHVEAGVACGKLARAAAKKGLKGSAFFAGIPGTLGGALAMNAGAFGGDTWSRVLKVETIDKHGERRWRERHEFQIGYRHVRGPADEWFISAVLSFLPGDVEEELAAIRQLLNSRKASQPIGEYTCGSVFKNPEGDHAARLIETAGMKGYTVGGACVSEKHANFIVNKKQATSHDIESLIKIIQDKVASVHQIKLEPEVRFI